jgi:hypothetical protein
MKVKELIEQLSVVDPESDVTIRLMKKETNPPQREWDDYTVIMPALSPHKDENDKSVSSIIMIFEDNEFFYE